MVIYNYVKKDFEGMVTQKVSFSDGKRGGFMTMAIRGVKSKNQNP